MDEVLCYVVDCQGSCGVSFSDTSDTCPECEGAADLVLEVTGNKISTLSYINVCKIRNICCTVEDMFFMNA